jgi:hypothetical protein
MICGIPRKSIWKSIIVIGFRGLLGSKSHQTEQFALKKKKKKPSNCEDTCLFSHIINLMTEISLGNRNLN